MQAFNTFRIQACLNTRIPEYNQQQPQYPHHLTLTPHLQPHLSIALARLQHGNSKAWAEGVPIQVSLGIYWNCGLRMVQSPEHPNPSSTYSVSQRSAPVSTAASKSQPFYPNAWYGSFCIRDRFSSGSRFSVNAIGREDSQEKSE